MKTDNTTRALDGLRALRALRPLDRRRLAAAVSEVFDALMEDVRAHNNDMTAREAFVSAVEYLQYRARLLDRLEDAYPQLGRMEWEVERAGEVEGVT